MLNKKTTEDNNFAGLDLQDTISASNALLKDANKRMQKFEAFREELGLNPDKCSQIMETVPENSPELIKVKAFLLAEKAHIPDEPKPNESVLLSKKEKMGKLLRHKSII